MLGKQSDNPICIYTGMAEFSAYANSEYYRRINYKFALRHVGTQFRLLVFASCCFSTWLCQFNLLSSELLLTVKLMCKFSISCIY